MLSLFGFNNTPTEEEPVPSDTTPADAEDGDPTTSPPTPTSTTSTMDGEDGSVETFEDATNGWQSDDPMKELGFYDAEGFARKQEELKAKQSAKAQLSRCHILVHITNIHDLFSLPKGWIVFAQREYQDNPYLNGKSIVPVLGVLGRYGSGKTWFVKRIAGAGASALQSGVMEETLGISVTVVERFVTENGSSGNGQDLSFVFLDSKGTGNPCKRSEIGDVKLVEDIAHGVVIDACSAFVVMVNVYEHQHEAKAWELARQTDTVVIVVHNLLTHSTPEELEFYIVNLANRLGLGQSSFRTNYILAETENNKERINHYFLLNETEAGGFGERFNSAMINILARHVAAMPINSGDMPILERITSAIPRNVSKYIRSLHPSGFQGSGDIAPFAYDRFSGDPPQQADIEAWEIESRPPSYAAQLEKVIFGSHNESHGSQSAHDDAEPSSSSSAAAAAAAAAANTHAADTSELSGLVEIGRVAWKDAEIPRTSRTPIKSYDHPNEKIDMYIARADDAGPSSDGSNNQDDQDDGEAVGQQGEPLQEQLVFTVDAPDAEFDFERESQSVMVVHVKRNIAYHDPRQRVSSVAASLDSGLVCDFSGGNASRAGELSFDVIASLRDNGIQTHKIEAPPNTIINFDAYRSTYIDGILRVYIPISPTNMRRR